jgi:hypothetical protein
MKPSISKKKNQWTLHVIDTIGQFKKEDIPITIDL